MFGVEYHIITSFLFLETLFSTFSKYSPTHESATHESAGYHFVTRGITPKPGAIASPGAMPVCMQSRVSNACNHESATHESATHESPGHETRA